MANVSKETFFSCDSYNQAKKQSQGYEDEFISSLEEIGEIMYRWKTPSEVWRFKG